MEEAPTDPEQPDAIEKRADLHRGEEAPQVPPAPETRPKLRVQAVSVVAAEGICILLVVAGALILQWLLQ